MLGLLFCGILSEYFQPGVITQSTDSLRVRAERSYKDAPTNFFGQVYLNLFRLGTLAIRSSASLSLLLAARRKYAMASFISLR